jgi:hypothetical protein
VRGCRGVTLGEVTNRALFNVNGDGLNQGFNGSSGQALNFTLRDPVGVRVWTLQTFDLASYDTNLGVFANPPRSSTDAPELVLVGTTSGQAVAASQPNVAITTNLPATPDAHSYIIRSMVDGGVDDKGRWDPTKVWERMITVNTVNGVRKIVATERTQYSDASWEEPFNKALELFRTTLVDQQVVQATTTTALPAYTRTGNNYQANANGAITSASTDGVTPTLGMRILHRHGPGAGADNGVIVLTSLGSAGTPWTATRSTDLDVSAEFVTGKIIPVAGGSTLQGTRWIMSVGSPFVLNTDGVTFFQYQSSGVYDVKQFGAVGNGVANDTTPISNARVAAIATGGRLHFPRGEYLTDNISITATAVRVTGDGHKASIIKARQTGAIVTFTGCTACSFEDIAIERKDGLFQTAGGYSLRLVNSEQCWTRNIRISYGVAGIDVVSSNDVHLQGRTLIDHLTLGGGQSALRYIGTAGVSQSNRCTVDWLDVQHTYNNGIHVYRGNWATGTVYAAGDLVFANDKIWECQTGGTSAGAGSGPTGVPGTDGPSAYTTGVTDNTVTWRFLIGNCFMVNHDNDANDLEINRYDSIGPNVQAVVMTRSNGAVAPTGLKIKGGRIRESIIVGISLDRGSRVFLKPDIKRVWGGPGITQGANHTGEVEIIGGRVEEARTNGAFFNAGGVNVIGTEFIDNSDEGSAVHASVLLGTNATRIKLIGITSRGTKPSFGVTVGSGANEYTITNCDLSGNVTGGLSDGSATTATSRVVRGNRGVSRTIGIPLKPFSGIGAVFTEEINATIPHILQNAVTSAGDLRFQVPAGLVPVGCRITKVAAIWGNQNNATLPVGTMPRVQFHRRLNTIGSAFINGVGNGTETQVGTFTDNTAVVATYKLLHEIAITGLSEIVVADAEYSVHFRGEDGANEQAGGTLVGIRITFDGD